MVRTIVDRVIPLVAVAIFVAALVVLYRQFADVRLDALLASIRALGPGRIAAAFGLTAASYLLLSGYDFLALGFIGRRLNRSQVLLASFTAFAFSNNIGFQLLSGGSTRLRVYSNLGLAAGEIGRIVAFCTFTYVLGVVTVAGFAFTLRADEMSSLLLSPKPLVVAAGTAMLAFSGGYLLLAAAGRWLRLPSWLALKMPGIDLALAQVALSSADAVLAATVIYVLLPPDMTLGFLSFIGIYMIASTASVFSLVPGGLGVFETAITLMTGPPSKAAALGTLLAYRLVYFIVPFVVAIGLFTLHEIRRMR